MGLIIKNNQPVSSVDLDIVKIESIKSSCAKIYPYLKKIGLSYGFDNNLGTLHYFSTITTLVSNLTFFSVRVGES